MRETPLNKPTSGGVDVEGLAQALATAEAQRRPLEPLTDSVPHLSVDDAYHIQQANILRRTRKGERIVGHKIGLTAKAMQELFNVNEPDYGHLLDTMVHDEQTPLDLSELIDPQVEVEPGFVLSRRLAGADLTIENILDATQYVCVCLEIIDSRVVDWRIKVQDTVADNGSSARIVIGAERIPTRSVNLEDLLTTLELDGEVAETGRTSEILGHPANGVAWLARALSRFNMGLNAGDIVLPGTCTRSRRLFGHEQATGRIDQLGSVSVRMRNQPFVRNRSTTVQGNKNA
jgi:2-keto-4-pentenoate hydratase